MTNETENDLPLVSNVNDILVTHYMLNFSCSFKDKQFRCSVILFLSPVTKKNEQSVCRCFDGGKNSVTSSYSLHKRKNSGDPFKVILDCHKICIDDVEEIHLDCLEMEKLKYAGNDPVLFASSGKLSFVTDKWSLKIWKDINTCKFCFPKLIRISYRAVSEGPSLLWVTDQDKNPAVFTYGAWINNRSLFPCQEPPSAMATWEAIVTVDNSSAVVLMSGDEEARTKTEDGRISYYYYTKNALPLSTLCIAIGFWQEHPIIPKYRFGPRCRIFAPKSLLDKSILELFEYAPYCLKISEETFGPYPFPRIDFLIVPPTFGSLGMASPNIVFLSQSLLSGDSSMCSRVAHEIAHGWFGLIIGASDWTEEWLSEGFATFIEDHFHVHTMNLSKTEAKDYIELRTYIRLRTLMHEISNTDEKLQVLSGQTLVETVDGVSASVLKNGQNRDKAFMQVHYIKGYFLLKHLSNIVGIDKFLIFMKGYIDKYYGKLVTSKDFLVEYFTWFPKLKVQLTLEEIYEKWLHNPGVVDELKYMKPSNSNKMYKTTVQEVKKWCQRNKEYLQLKSKRSKLNLDIYKQLNSEQQILLLESILEEPRVSQRTLKELFIFFNFNETNAEVQHRWFELVVKYKYKPSYEDLKTFLTNHLAMGVYLFGEMIFSKNITLRTIAEERYFSLRGDMEPNYVSTIQEMIKNVDGQ